MRSVKNSLMRPIDQSELQQQLMQPQAPLSHRPINKSIAMSASKDKGRYSMHSLQLSPDFKPNQKQHKKFISHQKTKTSVQTYQNYGFSFQKPEYQSSEYDSISCDVNDSEEEKEVSYQAIINNSSALNTLQQPLQVIDHRSLKDSYKKQMRAHRIISVQNPSQDALDYMTFNQEDKNNEGTERLYRQSNGQSEISQNRLNKILDYLLNQIELQRYQLNEDLSMCQARFVDQNQVLLLKQAEMVQLNTNIKVLQDYLAQIEKKNSDLLDELDYQKTKATNQKLKKAQLLAKVKQMQQQESKYYQEVQDLNQKLTSTRQEYNKIAINQQKLNQSGTLNKNFDEEFIEQLTRLQRIKQDQELSIITLKDIINKQKLQIQNLNDQLTQQKEDHSNDLDIQKNQFSIIINQREKLKELEDQIVQQKSHLLQKDKALGDTEKNFYKQNWTINYKRKSQICLILQMIAKLRLD
ncbi:UNKNOWN [Stylonychia lemnae]|uniref:Uncharacterized protein n=1 Tax=Stylonychia lemnae TaxID=5949 RepID=A0A078AW40_STYLE|nr:UNKNOWN [Stylonychia lemnae]|eukprot:CDW86301.1 UNKNOWN [Stylonychia lemnae]